MRWRPNLTGQVRNIAEVTTAVARGDLSKKITVDARGEILELKSTINTMVDQLNGFASEVSRVAREVGTEGKLGGQARAPGVAGTWKDLTDNVNAMAANLTGQVRAIAEVATAVTQGDLTRLDHGRGDGRGRGVEGQHQRDDPQPEGDHPQERGAGLAQDQSGEVLPHAAGAGRPGRRLAAGALRARPPLVLPAQQGVLYAQSTHDGERRLDMMASYASGPDRHLAKVVRIGEGLVGQCAVEKKRILLEDVQQDYLRISSSLGSAVPLNVVILPVLFEGDVKAVLELASIKTFKRHPPFAPRSNSPRASASCSILSRRTPRTRDLLAQSQSLTRELQKQQAELKQTNDPPRPAGRKSAEVREPAEDAAGGIASGKRRACSTRRSCSPSR